MTAGSAPLAGRRAVVVNWRDPWHRSAGGSERYAWEFAIALRDAGADVCFVTARDRGQALDERVDGIGLHRWGGPFTFYLAAAAYLWRRRRQIDVVVDTEGGIPAFAPVFCRRRTAVVLVVHHVHQSQFDEYFGPALAWVGRTLEAHVMPRIYRRVPTVAVSESTRQEMAERLGWNQPVRLLMNGANLPATPVLDHAHERFRLVALGRLARHKRVDLLIDVVDRLRHRYAGLRLDILGRGIEEDRLRTVVTTRGLADVVTVHGYVSDERKAELIGRAWLHLCASDREGWGQVVTEAAACGVPTVARDVPGLRDSVVDGRTGWLAPEDDDPAASFERTLVHALDELDNPACAADVRRSCRARAAELSWSDMHREAVGLVAEELDCKARDGA